MQDANRRRFWQSCLLGLMLLALAGNSHSDDSIINRVEALQAGEPVMVLGAPLHSRDALVQFYQARNYEPAWRSFPARDELLLVIHEVSNEGLSPSDYHYDTLTNYVSQPLENSDEDLQADLDLLLSDAFLLLATHLHDGKLDHNTRSARWQPSEQQRKMHEVLAAAILDHSIRSEERRVGKESGRRGEVRRENEDDRAGRGHQGSGQRSREGTRDVAS